MRQHATMSVRQNGRGLLIGRTLRMVARVRRPLLLLLALLAALLGGCQFHSATPAERYAVSGTLRQFRAALNDRSFELLQPVLAPDLRIDDMPSGLSRDGLKAGLPALQGRIVDWQILSLARRSGGLEGRVAFYMKGGVMEMAMGFTPDGRIRTISAGRGRVEGGVKMPDLMTSPFLQSSGLMFVQARVDGRAGWFLVDSGSSDFLLNRKYFTPAKTDGVFSISAGIHGVEEPIGMMEVGSFAWENLRATRINAAIKNLTDLERPENTPLLGAIGYTQLKSSAMVVDWGRRRIQLYATQRNGERKIPEPEPPGAVVPFSYDLHLPVLQARVGNRPRTFLFDSGASINLMPDAEGLAGHFRQTESRAGLSDGGQMRAVTAQVGLVDRIELGPVVLSDFPIMIFAIPYLEGRGLLGAPLLAQGRVEINFRKREMRFWR